MVILVVAVSQVVAGEWAAQPVILDVEEEEATCLGAGPSCEEVPPCYPPAVCPVVAISVHVEAPVFCEGVDVLPSTHNVRPLLTFETTVLL